MEEANALTEGDSCARCGRTDVDDEWLWLEVQRAADDVDCEFESVDLSFCSQTHAGSFLQEQQIDWRRTPGDTTTGTRVDVYFMGCGLLAILLSVVGVIALVRWIA